MEQNGALLSVRDLSISFPGDGYKTLAVRNVSFNIAQGKTMGFVGESGCGKSVTSYGILRLVPPPGVIESGTVIFNGKSLLDASDGDIKKVRGGEIAMIFQEPMTSLNPVFTIGYQLMESINLHCCMDKKEGRTYAAHLLDQVGIPDPSRRLDCYPHEFSGGMRQRAMIAMALSASPSLLIADEPTTALDVTIQSQILDLLLKLQEDRGMALLLITHDLGIVANIADTIAIMYAGEIVEEGPTAEIFQEPRHPYTRGLFRARPRIGSTEPLMPIAGSVPSLSEEPSGCVFKPRCPIATEECGLAPITMTHVNERREVRCIHSEIR